MRCQRWRLVHEGVEYLPYGTKQHAADYLAWLLELTPGDVFARLVRVDLVPGPSVAKSRLNTLAAPERASRDAAALKRRGA